MLWNNYTLIDFIKNRSSDISENLLPCKPIIPEDNPLVRDRVSRDAILLREMLDKIQGTEQDNVLTGQIVSAITIGSRVTPIPKDNPYSSQEVGDYMKYLNKFEEWENMRSFLQSKDEYTPYQQIDNISILSVLFSTEKNEKIIILSTSEDYIRELNTDPMENILGGRYRNQISCYYKVNPNEISEFLSNVDFEELRKRMINAGYSSLVNEINEELQHYL